jgi:hypothetical protein
MAGRAKPKILGFAKQSFDMGASLECGDLSPHSKEAPMSNVVASFVGTVRLGVLNVQVLRSSKYPANGHELVGPITGDG